MRSAVHEGILLNVVTLTEVAHYLRHLPKEEFQKRLDAIINLETLTLASLDVDLAALKERACLEDDANVANV